MMSAVGNPRLLLAAGTLIAVVVLGVVLLSGAGGGAADEDAGAVRATRASLTLERAARPDTGAQELVVSLPEAQLNTLETTGGESSVLLRCLDSGGEVVLRRQVDWPLLEEPAFAPHTHEAAGPQVLDSIRRCRLTGPGIDFDGAVSQRLRAGG